MVKRKRKKKKNKKSHALASRAYDLLVKLSNAQEVRRIKILNSNLLFASPVFHTSTNLWCSFTT